MSPGRTFFDLDYPGARNGEADALDVGLAENVALGNFNSLDVQVPLGKESLAKDQAAAIELGQEVDDWLLLGDLKEVG